MSNKTTKPTKPNDISVVEIPADVAAKHLAKPISELMSDPFINNGTIDQRVARIPGGTIRIFAEFVPAGGASQLHPR